MTALLCKGFSLATSLVAYGHVHCVVTTGNAMVMRNYSIHVLSFDLQRVRVGRQGLLTSSGRVFVVS